LYALASDTQLHSDGTYERLGVCVLSEVDQWLGRQRLVQSEFGSCSPCGPGCLDGGICDHQRECSVRGVVDGAVLERWYRYYWLHRDVVAGIVHLYDHNCHVVHSDRSHERHELHVHGDGVELGGNRFSVECFVCCGAVDRS